MNLATLALCAAHGPLVGIQRRRPDIAHAVDLTAAVRAGNNPRRTTADAACGRRVAILNPFIWWAPKVRGLPVSRCPECEQIHGTRVGRPPRWATRTPS